MEREGEVMRNRRGALLLPDKAGLIKGRVIGHPDGFGFLKPDDGREDLFLGPKEMHKALHGDTVLARVTGVDRRGRPEGHIVEVLERANAKRRGPRLHRARRGVRDRREQAHQPGHPHRPREPRRA